jgi:bifunctional DNA-binding transcriptional regulator/antitoxin component of YhaV-PrlF toxin-antitoxin module
MSSKKLKLKVGAMGEVKLPPEALAALEIEPGGEMSLEIDTRRKQLRLERHVDDAWGEAMKEKPQKGLEDLMDEQKQREQAAKEMFEKRIKEKNPKDKRRPEDSPDHWR